MYYHGPYTPHQNAYPPFYIPTHFAHEGDNKVLKFPYPIFWLPADGKPEEPVKDKKEIDATPKAAEDWPSKLKIVPLKLLDNENVVEKPGVLEEETKTQHSEKESKIKTIPVMHLDSNSGEKLGMADRPEDVLKDSVTEEKKYVAAIKKGSKKQPPPPKSSKLPPVCLRVDPLPKRNGSNGKGRSPSPPSLKDKVKSHEGNQGDAAIMKKDSDNTPKDIKAIDVEYQPSGEGGKDSAAAIVSGQDMKSIEEQCVEKDRSVVTTEGTVGSNKEESEDISINQQRLIVREGEKVDTSDNNKKQVLKNYSPEDAALLIQSAFRGFNVRRWKPLEKLQKIAQIRGKVNDLNSQIQSYEVSLERDVKQKVIISETIMNLLLQLDTIQGLLPSLRDIRKSVARDLVRLQDKLDQLYSQATNEHEEGTRKNDESSSSSSEEFMVVKPNEANKQSLFEDIALKEKSESKKETDSEEGSTIKPEDVLGKRNDEALEEESNVLGDAFSVSEELKSGFRHSDEGNRSEVYNNNSQELVEVSSEIPAAETGMIASTDKVGVDSLDLVNSGMIFEEKKLVEDNEKLRQMLEKLLNAGQEQMLVIAELNQRVKNLERKLSKRKKVKVNQKKLN